MNRQQLTDKYLKPGQLGLEIAGLHNPWPVPNGSFAIQLDIKDTPELRDQYPEMCHKPFTKVHVLDDGNYLKAIADNSMDFLLSSHVLEHMLDVITSIKNWLRVVKPGGHVLMAIPEMTQTFDKDRVPTTFEHVFSEWGGDDHHLVEHYTEYFSVVDKLSGDALNNAVTESLMNGSHIHFHCWTKEGLGELFAHLMIPLKFTLRYFGFIGHEVLVVLEKL